MPVLFGTLTALVLALSAWIGYKNQSEYKKQIKLRQDEELNYQKEEAKLKKLTEEWKGAIAEEQDFINKNGILSEEIQALDKNIKALQEEVKVKVEKKDRLEKEISDANAVMDKVGGARALVPKIRGLRSEIVNLKQTIEDGTAKLSNLKQMKADTEAVIVVNEKRVENETAGVSQPSLNTTIKTVYSSWGFVTLNGGDLHGVVPGSTLAVVRGGETLAKLKVSTVEANRAAADIVRESVGADVYLRSGDKVVAISTTRSAKDDADKAKVNAASKEVTAH